MMWTNSSASLLKHLVRVCAIKLTIGQFPNLYVMEVQKSLESLQLSGMLHFLTSLSIRTCLFRGVISQEVIKLCTHQFVPIDNTLVFDAMTGNSASVRLGGTCVQNSDSTMNMVQNDTFDGTTDSSQQTNASVDTDMLDLSTDVDEQQTSSSQNIRDGENGWQTIIQGFSSGKWADIRWFDRTFQEEDLFLPFLISNL